MKGRKEFTKNEANAICKLIEEKLKADSVKQKSIRQKIRTLGFYASDFGLRNGYTVDDFRRVVDVVNQVDSISFRLEKEQRIKPSSLSHQNSDEAYIINICDDVLHFTAKRQYKFSFLKGDTGKSLPVDAYYEELNLVIEYHGKQHTEEVHFFDKRITASGFQISGKTGVCHGTECSCGKQNGGRIQANLIHCYGSPVELYGGWSKKGR